MSLPDSARLARLREVNVGKPMGRSIEEFEAVTTNDGSPSLRVSKSDGYFEKMHHTGGAFSESVYIYHSALALALDHGFGLRVLSLGLGLAYNEILSGAEAVRRHIAPSESYLLSFESEPLLRDSLVGWLTGSRSIFANHYDDICRRAAERFAIDEERLRAWLITAYKDHRWVVRGPFPDDSFGLEKVSCVFFDAFSNKMNPELWLEDEIADMSERLFEPTCVFSTYACTGSLKRALKASGFERIPRPGFEGKRESTLAIRKSTSPQS